MVEHGTPTGRHRTFTDAAVAHRRSTRRAHRIKADGLAAGKGVVVALTPAEAHAAVDDMLVAITGSAGARP
jgi:phosphoribosylamine--glycine ligase